MSKTIEDRPVSRKLLPSQRTSDDPSHNTSSVRWFTATCIGLIGAALNVVIIGHVGLYLSGPNLGVDYLPIGIFCLFLILLAVNWLLGQLGVALSRGELIVAYVIMLVTAGIPQSGFAGRLIPMLTHVYYYATPVNEYSAIFHRAVPSWAVPTDSWVIDAFYEGVDDRAIPWSEWFGPLAMWLVPWGGMVILMASLAILFRQRWLEEERLTFPLALIPLAVMGNGERPSFNRSLFTDWVFWAAAAGPFFLRMLEGLHFHFPAVPYLPIGNLGGVNELFQISEPRWHTLFDTTSIEIHLALVGIAILMRSEVSASFWGFEIFYLMIGAVLMFSGVGHGQYRYTPNWTFGYDMFIRFARLGGSMAAVTYMLWGAREQIGRAWHLAFHPKDAEDSEEHLLRWAFWGLGFGTVIFLSWSVVGGMAVDTAIIMLLLQVVVIVIIARVLADGGILWASVSLDPMISTALLTGTEHLSADNVTMMVMANQMPLAPRGNIMPTIMDGFKLTSTTGLSPGKVLSLALLAVAVTSVLGLAMILYLAYTHGALYLDQGTFLGTPNFPWDSGTNYLLHPGGPNLAALATVGLGVALMAMFIWLHRSYSWWPVYPFGFALAESATMEHLWVSVVIGWAIRVVIVKIGGAPGYKRIRPAAIGVVVGEFTTIGLWSIINVLTDTVGLTITHQVSTW